MYWPRAVRPGPVQKDTVRTLPYTQMMSISIYGCYYYNSERLKVC